MASRAERAMSFGSIADDYDRLRPGPPDDAVGWLLPENCSVAVDLGAGTGLLTRALARRVDRVVAVEPDERMRAVLTARSPGVEVLAGRGEAIPLPDGCADGVFISSAWHWMDPELTVPEIVRVLRPGGRLGVVWTSRDREVGWLHDLGRQHRLTMSRGDDDAQAPRERHAATLPKGPPLENITTASFTFSVKMTVDHLVSLLGTYSGAITASARDRDAALNRARSVLQEQFPGASEIEVPMRSECWRADAQRT